MDQFFFRVEHDLLKSESFKTLGGSAVKVYLVVGLYSDFGSGWAFPSIRTIAKHAGLSRQTVLTAISELTAAGLLATNKSRGRSSAYRIIRQAPRRPSRSSRKTNKPDEVALSGQGFLEDPPETVLESLEHDPQSGPKSLQGLVDFLGAGGPQGRPELETRTREDTTASIPIPGTPFRLTADGRLQVAVDLQQLLTSQGIPQRLAERLAAQKDPEDVAKVLLNALYLQSQGKLQNGPGYIRAGLEEGYDLLPQVANRLELRRRELAEQLRASDSKRARKEQTDMRAAEDAAIALVIERLHPDELQALISQAVASLPEPIVRRNPTLSNPFIRTKVYELASGEPL
jgi:hypothetical protein